MSKSFLLSLQFLTIIPIKVNYVKDKDLANSLVFYPLIGFLLGLILVLTNNILLILKFKQLTISIILVVFLVVLTGGIHLDGLADTFDAFLSRKNKEEMLTIMRDSHIGVMGVLSLISVLLLKIAFLFSLNISLKVTLFLMCILSRWALVLSIFLFPYARQEGKAKVFTQGINFKIFFLATMITLLLITLIAPITGLLGFLFVLTSTCLIGKFINNKINGVTGDTLGAINELTELIILFSVCILEKSSL